MADRLPFGQLTPAARPIGAFINPAQESLAAPAKPQFADQGVDIRTIQRGSEGSVQGFSQGEQLSEALKPFNRALTGLLADGAVELKKSQIEAGYYDELKNQQARSMMSLQMQQEAGAANAAGQIGQLQKIDPTAGELLKQASPWKQIGIDRARAQLAGADIDNVLAYDTQMNAGYLATLEPGSPELMQRKATLTQGVLNHYQLTGDESAVQTYVTPRLNEAWDTYTEKHGKLRSDAMYQQSVLDTSALGISLLTTAVKDGLRMPDGTVLQPGTPEWMTEGQRRMTYLLDGHLRLLTPDDRAKALDNLRGDFTSFTGVPFVWDLITGTRVGDAATPYEKRPTWGAAQTEEFLKDRQAALSRRMQEANDNDALIKRDAEVAWAAGPGRFAPGTAEGTEASLRFREEWAKRGLRDVDGFIVDQNKTREALQTQLYPADPREAESFSSDIQALPANVWTDDPNALKNAQDQAWAIASREPTAEARNRKYAELTSDIEKAREQATKSAKDVVPGAKAATLEDLDSPEVRAIRKKQGKGTGGGLGAGIFQAAARGASATQAVGAAGDPKLTAAANQLERLYQASMQNKINAWQANHPTQVLSPEARQNLIAEARQEVRKSDQYAQIMTPVLGRPPAGSARAVTAGVLDTGKYPTNSRGQTFGQTSSTPSRGVSLQNLQNLPDSTVKGYSVRPVLDGGAMRSELQRMGRGEAPSPAMQTLARRAGVSPYRYMQEQLKFYPALDDENGSLRLMLQEKANAQRVGQSISSAHPPATMGFGMVPTGYNPLATGSWLMNMLIPPAHASEPSTLYPGGGSYGGGGGNYVATTGFGYSADRKTQTLHGIQGRPGYDASHGVGNDHVHHGANDPQTAMALAKFLKARGWPITEFKPWGSVGSHRDPGHYDGRTFDIPVATKDHPRVLADINAFYSGRSGGGGGGSGSVNGYLRRLSFLETRIQNVPNAEGSPGRGYFQAFPAFSGEAIAASGGIDPRDGNYDRAARATWAWIQNRNPRAAEAIKRGDYDAADRLLRNTWPSLPGGSQAQPDHVQREARRYLRG